MDAVTTTLRTAGEPLRIKQRRGRLTPEQVCDAFLSPDSTTVCGRRLGVSGAMVSMIRNRRAWAQITQDLVRPTPEQAA